MPLAIVSVCANEQLRESLQYVTQMLHLGPVYNFQHYISENDATRYSGSTDTIPIAFVSIDEDREAGMETAEFLRNHPDAKFKIVIVSTGRDLDTVFNILREGKYSFLPLPATATEIMAAIKRVVPAQSEGATAKRDGKVVLFAGASGGAGNTTIAVHAAVRLAEEGRKTLLVDHHRMLGHASLFLGLPSSDRSIYDLIANEERIDDSLLSSYVLKHSSGLSVLGSPEIQGATASDKPEIFKKVIAFLRAEHEFIVFDSPAGDIETGIVASVADQVFFVVSAEIASMRDLTRYAEFYGKDEDKFRIVVNLEGRSPVTADHVASHVGLPVAARFPELNGQVCSAVNAGKTVSPQVRRFHEPLRELINLIDPPEPAEEQKKARGWFPLGRRN